MPAADVGGLAGWVVGVIESIGAVGVALLVMLENVFPPIPSELVLAFAGFSAARGVLNPFTAWAAATAGSLAGAYLLYAVGARLGYDRLHELAGRRWFVLFNQKDLGRGERFFRDHGGKVVLLARVIPVLRSVVSIPAGMTRMPLGRFTLLTVVGSGVWNAGLVYAGFRLGERWQQVGQYVSPVTQGLLVALALYVALRVGRHLHERHARPGAGAGR